MQNVLLVFPNEVTPKQLASTLASLFEQTQNHSSAPDRYVLIKGKGEDEDAIFLRPCFDLEDNYEEWFEEWFEENQRELVMQMQSFVEMQYRKLKTAKSVLAILADKFEDMIIQFDDFYLTSAEFLAQLQSEPEWDWR